MKNTLLSKNDILPLTCSRKGTCCHGNQVLLNPWELRSLSVEKQLSVEEFINQYCDLNGIRLKFDGEKDYRGKKACNLYLSDFGCSVHEGRPLACRLFPLGRQIQHGSVKYMHQGTTFPCLPACSEVQQLPKMSVEDYLKDQKTSEYEFAQDAYLEIMQNIADFAFMLLLDTGLIDSGDTKTLQTWREISNEDLEQTIERIDLSWLQWLTSPIISFDKNNPETFIQNHEVILEENVQKQINEASSFEKISQLSIQLFSLALFLAKSLGADTVSLAKMWVEIAEENGAS